MILLYQYNSVSISYCIRSTRLTLGILEPYSQRVCFHSPHPLRAAFRSHLLDGNPGAVEAPFREGRATPELVLPEHHLFLSKTHTAASASTSAEENATTGTPDTIMVRAR